MRKKMKLDGIEFYLTDNPKKGPANYFYKEGKIYFHTELYNKMNKKERIFVLNHEYSHKLNKKSFRFKLNLLSIILLLSPLILITLNPVALLIELLIVLSVCCFVFKVTRESEYKADSYACKKVGLKYSISALEKCEIEIKEKSVDERLFHWLTHYSFKYRINRLYKMFS